MKRYDLPDILYDAIKAMGGQANIVDICKYIWDHFQQDLSESGNLFYTWQYDIRWAANELRNAKRMKDAKQSPKGIWEIV